MLRPGRFESDPKKAYTTAQLAEVGAITLKWNKIEAHIEFIASFIMFTKSPLVADVDRETSKRKAETKSSEEMHWPRNAAGR